MKLRNIDRLFINKVSFLLFGYDMVYIIKSIRGEFIRAGVYELLRNFLYL